ncbi:hypothetical protein R5W24_000897 [Gemmata sp. JC717]|uniref:hypothetical protein n=1 Tax=Gemmata algarum TaxID=2975278 RepID=UPI0021BAAD60|nr:hypothetical protein [Gemmata algarum]MDY3551817.1 hypothetical protein [Gemmata algarum]
MRLAAPLLFVGMVVALATAPDAAPAHAQDKKDDKKKAAPKVDPKTFIPDAATLKQIKDKTEELRKAIAALKQKAVADDMLVEVEIYLKAAENIVRFEEWLAKDSIKWTFATLEQGLSRAKQAEGGKAMWRDAPGKWAVRAYRSRVDDSIQPYAVLLPHDYGKDPKKQWRLDIVLHGRDAALTEAKFIGTHQGTAPKDLGYVQLEVYGRGNNAYRWAGETDVLEAGGDFVTSEFLRGGPEIGTWQVVIRGFSMGGAGTWHIGLHRPFFFEVIGPGAGFTTTHGYIANLPKELPDYQEKCLRIYDAHLYAENAFNVPVVAYSGEKDAQKKAADNIEAALKGFKEPFKFTHLVAPGLEHQMPKPWQEKAEAEFKKYLTAKRKTPERVRFVTFTTRWNDFAYGEIEALEKHYEKAVVDSTWTKDALRITTQNVASLRLRRLTDWHPVPAAVSIDGQTVATKLAPDEDLFLSKVGGKWVTGRTDADKLRKRHKLQGPIDDAFVDGFVVARPTGQWKTPVKDRYQEAAADQFTAVWDRYFRGTLRTTKVADYDAKIDGNLILFGDPENNPLIAKVLPKLPITWTKDELVVNGVKYDPKTHVPVLIYPNPLNNNESYVVINSGHTFKEADLKGTNALLYPRLGDWAVIKPAPTEKDPAAYEVVAAGLFDENWQFPKK